MDLRCKVSFLDVTMNSLKQQFIGGQPWLDMPKVKSNSESTSSQE